MAKNPFLTSFKTVAIKKVFLYATYLLDVDVLLYDV